MDILPLILSEDDFLLLSDEQRELLAQCSPSTIMVHVEAYLQSSSVNTEVAELVKNAYDEKLKQRAFLQNVLVLESVETVKQLKLMDIGPHMSLDELKRYQKDLSVILGSEVAVPYIAPVRKEVFEEFLFSLKVDTRFSNTPSLRRLLERCKKYKDYFYDSNKTGYVGTAVKFILRERQLYSIILHGIEFQIRKKEEGADPMSWRYL